MIDIVTQVNQTQRRVGVRTLQAGEARSVILTRSYETTVDDLWEAVTSAERIPRWFLPISGELRLGGRYQLEGNAGGTIERCEPPRSLSATWEYGGLVSWIELELTPLSDQATRLELTHIARVDDDDKWEQFGPGAVGVGWDLGLLGLSLHLASGGQADPDEARAWSTSESGREFMTRSSDAWRDANVAAGADPAEAQAAADRTSGFYTGTASPSGS
jgi:uncharacterized protein YndB with AHSA1/START domain